jgi:hypothetical protein
MVARKARRGRGHELVQGSGSRLESAHTRGLRWFTTKPLGYLVEPQNEDRRLGGWRRDLGAPRSFDVAGHTAGSQGLRREDMNYGKGVAARWEYPSLDHIAP